MSNNDIYLGQFVHKCTECDHISGSKSTLTTHFNHHHNPEWKANWEENNKALIEKNAEISRQKKLERISLYEKSPCLCSFCLSPIDYERKSNKFCSSSCAASYNNSKKQPRSEESRKKTSDALKGKKTNRNQQKICLVKFGFCKICENSYYFRGRSIRETCSRECQTHASVGNRTYINGRRLNIYYYNKHQQKEILLESSWEENIAKFLDEHEIKWIRPKFIRWIDHEGTPRLYYPDFYLPDFNLYLDPKNPTALALTIDKMLIVEKLIPILYGDKEMIKQKILSMI